MLKRIFALYILITIAFLPAYVFAHGGEEDGHNEEAASTATLTAGQPAAHEGITLAEPLSGRWWMLLGVSLVLMGLLSMGVKHYLDTDYPEGKDPMRFSLIYFLIMGILLATLILYGSGNLKVLFS